MKKNKPTKVLGYTVLFLVIFLLICLPGNTEEAPYPGEHDRHGGENEFVN